MGRPGTLRHGDPRVHESRRTGSVSFAMSMWRLDTLLKAIRSNGGDLTPRLGHGGVDVRPLRPHGRLADKRVLVDDVPGARFDTIAVAGSCVYTALPETTKYVPSESTPTMKMSSMGGGGERVIGTLLMSTICVSAERNKTGQVPNAHQDKTQRHQEQTLTRATVSRTTQAFLLDLLIGACL